MNMRMLSSKVIAALMIFTMLLIVSEVVSSEERVPVNEGTITITPDEGEVLTGSGYPIRGAAPRDFVTFTFWVNNDHSQTQTVIMELIAPEGWSVSVTGSVIVSPGGSESIKLTVSVPGDLRIDPDDDYPIRVDGVGNLTGDRGSSTAIIDLQAEIDHELLLTPINDKDMNLKLYPGQNTYVDVLLRNQGDMIDDIDLRIGEHLTDWSIKFPDGTESMYITIPGGESGSIFRTKVLIGIPETATIGQNRRISLISTSNMSSEFDTGKREDQVNIQVSVVQPSTLSIQPVESFMEIDAGTTADLQFAVTLTGVLPSTYEPRLRVLSGSFEQSGWISSIDLNGEDVLEIGETRTVDIQLTSPSSTSGTYDIILNGDSDHARVIGGQMTVQVRSGSNVTFTDLSISDAKLGSDVFVTFRVLNSGDSSQQVVLDLLDIPSAFIHDLEPSSFVIGPGNSRGVNVILYPKHDDPPLNFQFRINIKVPMENKNEWLVVSELPVNVRIAQLPNVRIDGMEIPNRPFDEGEVITINVTLSNPSKIDVEDLKLEVYEVTWSGSFVEIASIDTDLSSGEEILESLNWTTRPSASKIKAILVPPNGLEESYPTDNDMEEPINVRPVSELDPGMDPEGEGRGIRPEYTVAGVVGGSIIFTALALLVNSDYIRYPLFASLAPLYSKLKPEHLLSNRLRKRIYVYVQNNPGEHFRSILVNLDLTNGTLAHHLYTLEKENLVRSQRDGLYRRFYPAGYHIDENKISVSPIQKRIMELVEKQPGLSQKEISEKLELSNSTVNYNIKSLKDKGLIKMSKEGKSTHIFSTEKNN